MLIRLVLRRATAGRLLYVGFGLTTVLYVATWSFISKALCELSRACTCPLPCRLLAFCKQPVAPPGTKPQFAPRLQKS